MYKYMYIICLYAFISIYIYVTCREPTEVMVLVVEGRVGCLRLRRRESCLESTTRLCCGARCLRWLPCAEGPWLVFIWNSMCEASCKIARHRPSQKCFGCAGGLMSWKMMPFVFRYAPRLLKRTGYQQVASCPGTSHLVMNLWGRTCLISPSNVLQRIHSSLY